MSDERIGVLTNQDNRVKYQAQLPSDERFQRGVERLPREAKIAFQIACDLFKEGKYMRAKEKFATLLTYLDCSYHIQACRFYHTIEEADVFFEQGKFIQAIAHYQTAIPFNIAPQFLTERIEVSEFCILFYQLQNHFEICETQWNIHDYPLLAGDLLAALQDFKTTIEKGENIVFCTEDAQKFVEQKLDITETYFLKIHSQINRHIQETDALFDNRQYTSALINYQAIHHVIDCSDKIKACHFEKILLAGDLSLNKKEYEKAMQQYSESMPFAESEQLVEERLKTTQFLIDLQKAGQYMEKGNIAWNNMDLIEAGKHFDHIKNIHKHTLNLFSNYLFMDPDMEEIVKKGLQTLEVYQNDIAVKLEVQEEKAETQLAAGNYAKAKAIFSQLNQKTDVYKAKIIVCDFYIALKQGDDAIGNQLYDHAEKLYKQAAALNIEDGLIHERLVVLDFCKQLRAIKVDFIKGLEKWDKGNYEEAGVYFKTVLDAWQKTQSEVRNYMFMEPELKPLLDEHIEQLENCTIKINQLIKDVLSKAINWMEKNVYRMAMECFETVKIIEEPPKEIYTECRFQIALEDTDELLTLEKFEEAKNAFLKMKEEFSKASSEYDKIIKERLYLCKACLTHDEAFLEFIKGNKIWESGKRADAIPVLQEAFQRFVKAQADFSRLTILNEQIKTPVYNRLASVELHLENIEQLYKEHRQKADYLATHQDYIEAKNIYEQLSNIYEDSPQQAKFCDFYIAINLTDELLEKELYDEAIAKYQDCKRYYIDHDLINERLRVCEFGKQYALINDDYLKGIADWHVKKYESAMQYFYSCMDKHDLFEDTISKLLIHDPKMQVFVEKKVKSFYKIPKDINHKFDIRYNQGCQYLDEEKYVKAKLAFTSLPESGDIVNKINQCDFFLLLQTADSLLFTAQHQPALQKYEQAGALSFCDELIDERLTFLNLILAIKQSQEKYPVDIYENTEKLLPLHELKSRLAIWQNLNEQLSELDYKGIKQVQQVWDNQKQLVNYNVQAIQNALQFYWEEAQESLNKKHYETAREQFKELHPAMDVSHKLIYCDFHIQLAKANHFFRVQNYEEALNIYQTLSGSSDNIPEPLENHILACRFCQSVHRADKAYLEKGNEWQIGKHSEVMHYLKQAMEQWETLQNSIPKTNDNLLSYLQNLIVEKTAIIPQRIAEIKQHIADYNLDTQYRLANDFMLKGDYQRALDIFESLHPSVDCSQKITNSKFQLDLKIGDEFLKQNQLVNAAKQYQSMTKYEVYEQYKNISSERLGIMDFIIIMNAAEKTYLIANQRFSQNKNTNEPDDDTHNVFKIAEILYQYSRRLTPKVHFKQNDISNLITARLRDTNTRLKEIKKYVENKKLS